MATGSSLHIGLNEVDPGHYQGWSGPLNACEADAQDIRSIAQSCGFESQILLTRSATRKNVKREISSAAERLGPGDIFLLSYSGHGGQLPDRNGDDTDQQDETWCLFDGQLLDDEIYSLLGQFREGVRVLALSDSCHSGTVIKLAYYYDLPSRTSGKADGTVYRAMPNDVAMRVYRANKEEYDKLLDDEELADAESRISASALLISGCQDNQLSMDGTFNGLFTGTLLRVWANGGFHGNYSGFHNAITLRMPPDQTPNYFVVGTPDAAFESQVPFTI